MLTQACRSYTDELDSIFAAQKELLKTAYFTLNQVRSKCQIEVTGEK